MEQAKIAAAFVKAQRKFSPALKTATNPHFKSKYADLSACVEAVIDALNSEGIALMQHTKECDSGVSVETVFLHESGERLSSGPLHVPASKSDPQGYGSALTYCRRYSLMAACGIAPEDDDGNAASKGSAKITPTSGAWDSMSPDEQIFLQDIANQTAALIVSGDIRGAVQHIEDQNLQPEEKVALWTRFDSKQRAAMKRASDEMKADKERKAE